MMNIRNVVRYSRIYADPEGESHLQDAVLTLRALDSAPPCPVLYTSAFLPTDKIAFNSLAPNWLGDWRPTPARQLYITLAGVGEVGTSDGEVRRFGPGSILLLDDTTGKGHQSQVVGAEGWMGLFIQLTEGSQG